MLGLVPLCQRRLSTLVRCAVQRYALQAILHQLQKSWGLTIRTLEQAAYPLLGWEEPRLPPWEEEPLTSSRDSSLVSLSCSDDGDLTKHSLKGSRIGPDGQEDVAQREAQVRGDKNAKHRSAAENEHSLPQKNKKKKKRGKDNKAKDNKGNDADKLSNGKKKISKRSKAEGGCGAQQEKKEGVRLDLNQGAEAVASIPNNVLKVYSQQRPLCVHQQTFTET